ncbi:excinuclease ABC subunit UvrB [Patescibacteria group bacterium]|nr:excinuclease ABC subunit UvrB [Patescibacteria group bacterium]
MFKLVSNYQPTGDQPQAIEKLTDWVKKGCRHQTLLGVTGSGKTFTVANLIQNVQKPTLIMSHNKTLAAQLYQEFKQYFPENAVEYFVSYYDYYQPESYIPQTDTYIEKDADINEEIDKMRLSATTSLMTRRDVLVVASVSCIYNLGSPAEYSRVALELRAGMRLRMSDLLMRLSQIYYERDEFDFKRGTYRVRGDTVDVYPAYVDYAVRLEVLDGVLLTMAFFEPLTGEPLVDHTADGPVMIYPAKHYVTNEERREDGIKQIELDLDTQLAAFKQVGKQVEAYRLEQRTRYDLEMLREIGYCKGIENYSRYFDGRQPGEPPFPLLDFFPPDSLTVIDESHISIPQIRGMYHGDRSRKQTLIDFGFRLPSALDNRPLNFEEFLHKVGQVVYTSATPEDWEVGMSQDRIAEQLVRPTGILDPLVTILPTQGQVADLVTRISSCVKQGERVLVTTLTKRMAEELSAYLLEKKLKVTYLHSDIDTLERTDILDNLRRGEYDVLVGINLLREGLDLPEVSLVAILDADKEGFLRSQTSLIQTMGRAARHVHGQVVMYADHVTGSMQRAVEEVTRRRAAQESYNRKYGITPVQITKPIREKLVSEVLEEALEKGRGRNKGKVQEKDYQALPPNELKREIKQLETEMKYQAEMLNFEKAAALRDLVRELKKLL